MEKIDRISSFSDDVIHNILSSLDMKEVVHTSLLSRRWRNVWRLLPIINFDRGCFQDIEGFIEFGNAILLLRDNPIKVFKFSMIGSIWPCEFLAWINSLVTRNVQEIDLKGGMDIFSYHFSNLGPTVCSLHLVEMIFAEDLRNGLDVVLDFPSLRFLTMKNCEFEGSNKLTINAPNLNHLILNDEVSGLRHITINGPKIQVFKCYIQTNRVYSLDNMSFLHTAYVDAKIIPGNDREVAREEFGTCYDEILKAIANTRALTLCAYGFQVFWDMPNVLNPNSISFHNLRHLKLTGWSIADRSNAIAEVLEIFSYIETLVIERTEMKEGIQRGLRGPELLPHQFASHQLKRIEILNFQGCDNEFKLLRFLLSNAKLLERLILTVTRTGRKKRRQLTEFCQRLLQVPTASPQVIVRRYQWKSAAQKHNLKARF